MDLKDIPRGTIGGRTDWENLHGVYDADHTFKGTWQLIVMERGTHVLDVTGNDSWQGVKERVRTLLQAELATRPALPAADPSRPPALKLER